MSCLMLRSLRVSQQKYPDNARYNNVKLRSPELVPAVEDVLLDAEEYKRSTAEISIDNARYNNVKLRSPELVPAVEDLLLDAEESPELVSAVEDVLLDAEEYKRSTAEISIDNARYNNVKLRSPELVPAVEDLLLDAEEYKRSTAEISR
ncbi:hypothetical protein J6590_000082 [Homalodisca vitripennis]|nr:hypothetical protein J6590_000082 [Homalodisca vitripennis]